MLNSLVLALGLRPNNQLLDKTPYVRFIRASKRLQCTVHTLIYTISFSLEKVFKIGKN